MVWLTFVGSRTLVAGSVFQAVLELQEQNNIRDEVANVLKSAPPPAAVSAWWWLVPPIAYAFERRRWKARQETMMAALADRQRTLLATSETRQVCDAYDWSTPVTVMLVVAAMVAAVSFTPLWLWRHQTGVPPAHLRR